jgi:protein phosphatase
MADHMADQPAAAAPAKALTVPELALVVLIGVSGSGKSTFARQHFRPTEVLSSDFYRGIVADDENDQGATRDAFAVLHFVAAKRLAAGRLTVIDATNVQPDARRPLVALAREHHVTPVAIVFNLPQRLCLERNRTRPERDFGPHVIRRQHDQLRRSLRGLNREGFRRVYVLHSPEELAAVRIVREPLRVNRLDDTGPFDVVGDVHGCLDELHALLAQLGYERADEGARHPAGRKAVFLGDLVDRGPDIPGVLRLVMAMVAAGQALCVPGNHDVKLLRKLRGANVHIAHGLAESLAQLEREPPEFVERVGAFLDGLPSHYVLDGGRLVVAHAGLRAELHGRVSGRVRDFALYGETTGETDEFGLPQRYNWAAEYRGDAIVVYGHTPVFEPEWLNNTINIDTGCVFGGRLTALRCPERELVSVPAARTYAEPVRPLVALAAAATSAQQQHDELLEVTELLGRQSLTTRLRGRVTIPSERATTALEVMERFAVDPHWLIYLPPTMSPSETSQLPGLLEHPDEAFGYYRQHEQRSVVCEEKHMGSRAVVVLCRDEDVARRRFGVPDGTAGVCYTRTGRPFFGDRAVEAALLASLHAGLSAAGLWDELATGWVCLDGELMPWSYKAQELVLGQYATVGAAARAHTAAALSLLEEAAARGLAFEMLPAEARERAELARRYSAAYRAYVRPVETPADLTYAPFHLLASEGGVHVDKDHLWHLALLERLQAGGAPGPRIEATAHRVVELDDPASVAAGVSWWEELTAGGAEGMVVKPREFVAHGPRGLVQPALKCRGPEYLRIIYGPEYTRADNLERLRRRGLGAKRALALREFALGVEALERFVRHEPLRQVHACCFGVLALESEPVDPRL